MRRLFIIRKDLNLKPGKLAAMIGHCSEAYWTNMIKKQISPWKKENEKGQQLSYVCNLELPIDIVDEYVFGIFTKTICEAKNLNDLKKAEKCIDEINGTCVMNYPIQSNTEKAEPDEPLAGRSFDLIPTISWKLREGIDYGYINDKCLTDLTPENPDGTTTVGMWFRPLPDDIAHKISRKYKLYGAFDKSGRELTYYEVTKTSSGGMYDTSTESLGKYSTYEEAKKHFDSEVESVKSHEIFKNSITSLEEDVCKYNDEND